MKHDVISKLQDLTALSWDERAVTTGTGGVFLKARASTSRGDIYYKLSNYDCYRGIFGLESANEVIASRLLDLLVLGYLFPVVVWICWESTTYRIASCMRSCASTAWSTRHG